MSTSKGPSSIVRSAPRPLGVPGGRCGGSSWPRYPGGMSLSATDVDHLRRAVELARHALELGDEPFGSVLVGADGTRLFEDHNRVGGGDHTQHPEFAAARWAAANLSAGERAVATV